MSDYFNLNEGVQKVDKNLPQLKFKFNRNLLFIALILLAIPFTVIGSLIVREYRSKAAVGDIARVDINPGSVESIMGGKNTQLSALAYDSSGNPITSGVSYQWSMSSINSVGTLSRTSGDITEFIPFNTGCGEITVIAIANGITITKATSVSVANELGISSCSAPTPTNNPSSAPTPTPTITPSPTPALVNRVFITSTGQDGNLGGVGGADGICQARANAANLGGNWKAWISDANISASERLIHSSNPYKHINGILVATNWDDLVDGSISKINYNEFGVFTSSGYVWTGTKSDGAIKTTDINKTCNNWTNNSLLMDGYFGSASHPILWSDYNYNFCASKYRLYCFEQVSLASSPTPTEIPTPTPSNSPVPTPTPIPGDYDRSGAVGLEDFDIWKNEFLGNSSTNKSDVNNDGRIDLIDYIYWRNNYQL